ncbi:MAG TPA: hypothetical protein VH309_12570 [Elusimicrobiota bacterium]|nr:hypothetical protein [Elusimicrobiota bacterium]
MTRLARRLRAALAVLVSAAVVVLSPGLEAPRLFAQVVVRAVPVEGLAPVAALPAASISAAAPLLAPSALSAAPSLSAPAAVAAAPAPAAAALTPAAPALTPAAPAFSAPAPADPATPAIPAAAPAAPRTVNSAVSYRVHRFILSTVAALTGAVFTQPVAGPALTRKLISSAADRRAVFSDYDDTLAAYNQVLPADMVSAVEAVKAAGKSFVVISDRGDEPRAHQLTVFESLASLPVETRAGMYVAANSGGRVYRYDAKGEPVRVFEAPALDEASKAKVAEAAAATKARLKDLGAEIHVPSAANNNPTESWGTYGYALMLKVGSSNEQVRGAADILQSELRKRGLSVEVNPRFAKDPANPPYINFSIVTKQASASFIAQALKLKAKDVVVIGDSMYAPHEAQRASWLARLGAAVGGRALPATGNRTDANMEKAVPGALTLGVGTTGDPRASNLWVLSGKGPAVAREVLLSVASKSRAALDARRASADMALHVAGAAAIIAATVAAYYLIGHALVDWLRQAEQQLRQQGGDWTNGGALFGGVLGAAGALGRGRAVPAKAASLADSVSPKSPVEGFSTFVYAEALAAARAHAAELGYSPDNLRVTGAFLSPRAWGEDWTFSFVSPREGYFKEPRGFELSARRTQVAETLVDVHGLKDLGRSPLFVGFRAAELPAFVKIDPMSVILKSGGDARSLEVRARWTGPNDAPELWYVVRGEKGRELAAYNARTGAKDQADRWAGFKSAALTIAALAATAGLYAAIYWAIAHAPAATSSIQVPPGWQGPVPSNVDIGSFFGGTLGLAGLAGTLRAAKKPKVGDEEISAAAKSVIAYKGGVWSQTEYNVGYYNTIENLSKRGATKAQLAAFRKLCDEAPVIGGRFNPWSGD